jgi:CRP/FNR family transcriptional regulator, cyclic AMP receptor protein
MVSPELLRRYHFFAMLNEEQLQAIAMISQEKTYPKNMLLLKENTAANTLMLLLEGDVDLIYSGGGEGAVVNALVGSIAPGEILGVSALIEPYIYICTARATQQLRVVEIDGQALRELMKKDARLGFALMNNTASAVLERLKYTQVELAAARA